MSLAVKDEGACASTPRQLDNIRKNSQVTTQIERKEYGRSVQPVLI